MRHVAILAGAVVATMAWPASAGKGPAYAEIPVSQLGARPTVKPKSIGARESIPGIKAKLVETNNVLSLETTTGKAATKASELGGCIGPMGNSDTEGIYDAESYNRPAAGVFPIRAEKLVDAADGTTKLEITDAWFDARTRGMRVIARSTLALNLHATIPGGMRILVGRDEHGGKKLVQFVVAEAKDTPAYLLGDRRQRLTRVATDTSTQLLGMCSHHRVAVPTGGPGESVSFALKVILPPLANGEKSNVATELRPMTEWEKKAGAKDVRTREVRIALGVSQTSRDKDPVLSISTEWAGDESAERVYTEREATFRARGVFGPDSSPDLEDPVF
jgi:hypothetical protein